MSHARAVSTNDGKGISTFLMGSLCWLGKTLPPHMCWARRLKINRFLNLSKFSMGTVILVAVPVDTAGGAVPSSFFSPNLPRAHVRKPVPFVWLTLCLLGRMNLEGCVYSAQGKHPNFRLNLVQNAIWDIFPTSELSQGKVKCTLAGSRSTQVKYPVGYPYLPSTALNPVL